MKHAGSDAAAIARGPFALGDQDELRSIITGAGFIDVAIHQRVKMLTFPSNEEFLRRYGMGSPLAGVLTKMTAEALDGLVRDVSAMLASHLSAKGLEFPIEGTRRNGSQLIEPLDVLAPVTGGARGHSLG